MILMSAPLFLGFVGLGGLLGQRTGAWTKNKLKHFLWREKEAIGVYLGRAKIGERCGAELIR